jgi:hypothetical protein
MRLAEAAPADKPPSPGRAELVGSRISDFTRGTDQDRSTSEETTEATAASAIEVGRLTQGHSASAAESL